MQLFGIILVIFVVVTAALPATANTRPRAENLTGPIPGEVVSILDGDTLAVRVHVWIGQELLTDVRVRGIDTPETRSACAAERQLAAAARAEVQSLVKGGGVVLRDIRLEKYAGRVLATVHTPSGTSVADHLIERGMARPYEGKKRHGWCDDKGRLLAAAATIASNQE